MGPQPNASLSVSVFSAHLQLFLKKSVKCQFNSDHNPLHSGYFRDELKFLKKSDFAIYFFQFKNCCTDVDTHFNHISARKGYQKCQERCSKCVRRNSSVGAVYV